MDKRLLTALFLCFLLLWVHTILFPPPERAAPPEQTTDQSDGAGAEGEQETADDDEGAGTDETSGAGDPAVDEQSMPVETSFETSQVEAEEEIVVETGIYRAAFTNRGAALKSLKFRDFFNDPEIQKDPAATQDPANWLEILGATSASQLSFVLNDAGGSTEGAAYDFSGTLWESSLVETGGGGAILTFSYRPGDGLKVRKIFTFHGGAYEIDLRIEVENENPDREKGSLNLTLDALAGIYDQKRASFTLGPTAVLHTDLGDDNNSTELLDFPATDLQDKTQSFSFPEPGEHLFSGVMSNYFALLVRPGEGRLLKKVVFRILEDESRFAQLVDEYVSENKRDPSAAKVAAFSEQAETNVLTSYLLKVARVPKPGGMVSQDLVFFAGPKSTDVMKQDAYLDYYPLIEDSYGSFAWINKGLIWILKQFYAIFGNWGVAIICLTFVIKIMLFPLNRYQQTSMHKYQQKMAVMKPKLDELKKKFKNNKKKFNEAQMKLMKEHGATPPLMGCMVIFFQLPVFIGLFQALRTSFELRHSPFCLWIKDLSQPDALPLPFSLPLIGDTLNVVPILMTVAFFYQQKSMPKPTDPQSQQMQKVMKFMPILFGVLFYGYASGLSLYWMTSNLISIVEFKVIRKKFPVGNEAPPAPPAPPEKKKNKGSRRS